MQSSGEPRGARDGARGPDPQESEGFTLDPDGYIDDYWGGGYFDDFGTTLAKLGGSDAAPFSGGVGVFPTDAYYEPESEPEPEDGTSCGCSGSAPGDGGPPPSPATSLPEDPARLGAGASGEVSLEEVFGGTGAASRRGEMDERESEWVGLQWLGDEPAWEGVDSFRELDSKTGGARSPARLSTRRSAQLDILPLLSSELKGAGFQPAQSGTEPGPQGLALPRSSALPTSGSDLSIIGFLDKSGAEHAPAKSVEERPLSIYDFMTDAG